VLASSCAGSGNPSAPPAARRAVVTVLTSPGCAQTEPAIDRLQSVAARLGIELVVERATVETAEDARRLRFLGSPTILVNGRDLDPEARDRTDYGFT
jgi:hypothetical protein